VNSAPELEVFREGDPLYARMLGDIEVAEQCVWMESYIFTEDRVGEAFITALCASARRGVDVRLRIDSAGSWGEFSYAAAVRLQEAGVRFKWCPPSTGDGPGGFTGAIIVSCWSSMAPPHTWAGLTSPNSTPAAISVSSGGGIPMCVSRGIWSRKLPRHGARSNGGTMDGNRSQRETRIF